MSNVSFKKFVSFVNLEGDVSDEQINEIFGLFKNDKVEKLKKERERLKGMSDKKKAELDQALKDFKDGKKTMPKGALSHDVWDDALSGDDKAALARHDKDMARQAEKDKAEKDSGPKNRTGRNFYEADATVKAIKLKIDPDMSDADIWNFIENQDEVTIEDFEKKGDTLYLYPYIDIEIGHPKLKGMQQRLQRMI